MSRQRLVASAMVAGALLAGGAAYAGPSNDTLNWASDSEPDSFDMYQNTVREGIILGRHVWDSLMEDDPSTGTYAPALAESFKWIDPQTIEFKLKQGIKFHNGEPFDADDVVSTVNHISNPESKIVALSRSEFLAGAEKIDQYTVRLKLKEQFPAAMQYLSSVIVIYPNEYFAKVGTRGMATKPVGTGPYKATSIAYGDKFTFEINKDYKHGPKKASISKMSFRAIQERNTQIAELLSGGLDWIWRLPPDQAKKMTGRKGLTVTEGDTMRVAYLMMDAVGKTGKDNNPMTNVKVRKAISHAINRQQIMEEFVGKSAQVLNVFCYPTQFGCLDKSAPKYDYNPAKAKALLAEAGYPNGFETPIFAYRDRPAAEAMIGDLRAIGITAKLTYLKSGAHREWRRDKGMQLSFGTWGSSSINDLTAIMGNFFTGSEEDHARDEEVWKLMTAGNTIDEEARKVAYEKALTKVAEQAYVLPLFSMSYFYVYSDQLEFTPSPDELPRFWNARWKQRSN